MLDKELTFLMKPLGSYASTNKARNCGINTMKFLVKIVISILKPSQAVQWIQHLKNSLK